MGFHHCILQEKTSAESGTSHVFFFDCELSTCKDVPITMFFFSMPFSLFGVPQDSLARTFSEPAKAMWRPLTIRGLASGYSAVFSEVPWLSHEKVGWLVFEPLPKWMEFLGWKS